jgi:NAD-dependent deacetylase
MNEMEQLREWIHDSDNIVFFGGAGVSTESNIPDFRSVDGLYNQEYDYPPETILSHTFFMRNTPEFYRFYRNKMIFPDAEPNKAHLALAELEKQGKLKAVITQNIDGLHQAAGSKSVYELHGTIMKNYCTRCGREYPLSTIIESKGIPRCQVKDETGGVCNGIIKPKVVLYEEGLDDNVVSGAIKHIRNADMLIIGGTSLTVYPAAGLIRYFSGRHIVLINKAPTSSDSMADLIIREPIGETLGVIVCE